MGEGKAGRGPVEKTGDGRMTENNNTHATMQRGHASGSDRNARASTRFVMMMRTRL